MIYFCCEQLRREAVRGHATLNGIDFLEVLDDPALPPHQRQRTLLVHFVKPLNGGAPAVGNVRIEGGERVRGVGVTAVTAGSGDASHILTVQVDRAGDFSTYTLRLVQEGALPAPPAGFDPMLSAVDFSFKVQCPTEFDCRAQRACPPEPPAPPDIDYLAKDYASFRRLMLDRMALLAPRWRERNPADLGVALVELLAVVGDYLSYQQDAIATEAYLGTARRRVSVRRHARLVDYPMHDGCNARAWVQLRVDADVVRVLPTDPPPLALGTPLFTRIPGQPVRLPADPAVLGRADAVFETLHPVERLLVAHNDLPFYAWGDRECCLPKGATRATLKGHYPDLRPGDVLLFEEVLGPRTGQPADADPARRHPVRLTEVTATDANGDPLTDPLNAQPFTEVRWHPQDALPFPFCLSARTDAEHGGQFIEDVSLARGNMVLVDHGHTVLDEPLGSVPRPTMLLAAPPAGDRCQDLPARPVHPRFRPRLQERPLTHAPPYDPAGPARAATGHAPREALPAIVLESTLETDSATWVPRRDLLASGPDAREFVVEIETEGEAALRFGDGVNGLRPPPETAFRASYRVGNGVAGNVGAEAIAHILTGHTAITAVRNPLAARGGVEPEGIEDVRQRAPGAFRTQQRAVTEADYAEVTERHAGVQRAAATFRWTGSWHTAFLTVDRLGGLAVDDAFETEMRRHVERFRMAGHDVEVDGPRFVPLEVEMHVCVAPEYFRGDVAAALLDVFSNRTLPDGRPGVFHPDHFTFGQPVYLSRLYAAAQAVPGVASVNITIFRRQGTPDPRPLAEGRLALDRLEIARLDNDPSFPERGVLRLRMGGGK